MPPKERYEDTDEFRYFIELTKIPRPSGHLDRIRSFLREFADSHGLDCTGDAGGNLLIRRRGTGRTVVLQGHMDIVATSASGVDFDFVNQPLETYVKDGWVRARGTTLGGDDGGGLALMLCALSDPALEGADLECLFTADEEIGLIGAMNLGEGLLTGKYLLNLDSEDVDEITIGSAGSADIVAVFPFICSTDGNDGYVFTVKGLPGGHSAGEIGKGRSNAILVAAGFLEGISGVRIADFEGGSASNVIPMWATVRFTVPHGTDVKGLFDGYSAEHTNILNEPGSIMSLDRCECSESWSEADSHGFLEALKRCPNEALEFDNYGVKTSSNIGVVRGTKVIVKPRSSDYGELLTLIGQIREVFSASGAEVPEPVAFPAWRESEDSLLVRTSVKVYRDCFGKDPLVTVTHGGLESSTIKDRYPGMEAVSVGPTVLGAHTPDERMDLSTLTEMKRYVFELVRALSV